MKTIALTGGGTAGHIMPNLALIPELRKKFDRIIYLGAGGMEEKLAKERGIRFFKTEAVRLERKEIWKNVKIPFVLNRAIGEAAKILEKEKVDFVFAKGGYVALPAAFAARRLKIPFAIHESDYSMGVANRLLSKFADGVITSFPETSGGVFLGNPVRDEVFFGNPNRVKEELKLTEKPTLLVVGGSLGAEVFNRVVGENLEKLTAKYNVLHIAGKGYDPSRAAKNYHQFPMTDKISDLYAAADVVLTRAGANTLTELAALGKRTVAVPLPKGDSRGDQVENARSFEKRKLVTVLEQRDFCADTLTERADALLKLPPPHASGKGETNRKIVEYVWEILNEKNK